jgi:hypothetical protein
MVNQVMRVNLALYQWIGLRQNLHRKPERQTWPSNIGGLPQKNAPLNQSKESVWGSKSAINPMEISIFLGEIDMFLRFPMGFLWMKRVSLSKARKRKGWPSTARVTVFTFLRRTWGKVDGDLRRETGGFFWFLPYNVRPPRSMGISGS